MKLLNLSYFDDHNYVKAVKDEQAAENGILFCAYLDFRFYEKTGQNFYDPHEVRKLIERLEYEKGEFLQSWLNAKDASHDNIKGICYLSKKYNLEFHKEVKIKFKYLRLDTLPYLLWVKYNFKLLLILFGAIEIISSCRIFKFRHQIRAPGTKRKRWLEHWASFRYWLLKRDTKGIKRFLRTDSKLLTWLICGYHQNESSIFEKIYRICAECLDITGFVDYHNCLNLYFEEHENPILTVGWYSKESLLGGEYEH